MNTSRGLIDFLVRMGVKPTGDKHRDMIIARKIMNKKLN